MGLPGLTPHDETILFQLVEIERGLPREEQSWRFQVEVLSKRGEAPAAMIQPAATSKVYRLKTDIECFRELGAAGYISGGRHVSSHLEGAITVKNSLSFSCWNPLSSSTTRSMTFRRV